MSTASPTTSAWIRRFHAAPQAPAQFVCFPHAGGSASYFFPLSRALSPGVDVLAIQYPGRQDRRTESCVDDVHRMADLVVAELRAYADRPTLLFGHSLGASVAFEVARRLEEQGVDLLGLFASGRRPPSQHRTETAHQATDAELAANLRRMSGTDSAVLDDDEMLRSILPALRSDYRAAETYRPRPGPGLRCPISVLVGDDDPEVTPAEADGWAAHTGAAFTRTVFRGGHFYLNTHADAVVTAIRRHLGGVAGLSSGRVQLR